MSSLPLEKLPTIKGKLGSVIVIAVGVTVVLIFLMLGYGLRGTSQDTDRLTLVRVARREAVGSLVGAPEGVVIVRTTIAGTILEGAPPAPLPVVLDGMVHVGSTQELEYAVVPVVVEGQVTELVYAVHPAPGRGVFARVGATFAFLTDFWWQFLVAGGIAAGIALLMARWLARGMTQPLRDMAKAARRMEQGDYSVRVHAKSRRRGRPARGRLQPHERRAGAARALPSRPRRERLARAQDADHRDPRPPREPARRRRAARTPRPSR